VERVVVGFGGVRVGTLLGPEGTRVSGSSLRAGLVIRPLALVVGGDGGGVSGWFRVVV
jgi:hypothetical protein